MRTRCKLLLLIATLALNACADKSSLPCRCEDCGHNTRCANPYHHPTQGASEPKPPATFDNPEQLEQDGGNG